MDKNQKRYYSMKSRCYCKTNKVYPFYGGRGIKVCDRWLGKNGFKHFMEDMGEPPTEEIEKNGRSVWSLDRMNPNGDYCPENCKWSTRQEQALNRRHKSIGMGVTGEMHITYEPNRTSFKKYRVIIQENNKVVYRKAFETLAEATKARDKVLNELCRKRGY